MVRTCAGGAAGTLPVLGYIGVHKEGVCYSLPAGISGYVIFDPRLGHTVHRTYGSSALESISFSAFDLLRGDPSMVILAWWYVHVSDVPSSLLRFMHYYFSLLH